jgi:hypothetical protein
MNNKALALRNGKDEHMNLNISCTSSEELKWHKPPLSTSEKCPLNKAKCPKYEDTEPC